MADVAGGRDVTGLPRLRPVEAFPVEAQGSTFIALRDPEGVAEDAVVLSPPAFFIASLLDGTNGPAEIKAAVAERFGGHQIKDEEIGAVVRELDGRGLLETPAYRARKAAQRKAWAALPVRPASHAGQAYPAKPDELRPWIRGLLSAPPPDSAPGGPGRSGPGPAAASPAPVATAAGGRLILPGGAPGKIILPPGVERSLAGSAAGRPKGLVIPHIDFARGGAAYAETHRTLLDRELPELVVILGVAHQPAEAPYIATAKSFETPLGRVETDGKLVAALESAVGAWVTADDIAHRMEHSIEFQLVWLQALHPDANFRILPVLCGPIEGTVGRRSPLADPAVADFIAALRDLLKDRDALIIASVDLSHVGPRFGDEVEVNEALATAIREADGTLIAQALSRDAEGFWAHGTHDGNARKVDALSAVYTMLELLGPGEPGRKLAYGQAPDPAGGIVSYCGVAYG